MAGKTLPAVGGTNWGRPHIRPVPSARILRAALAPTHNHGRSSDGNTPGSWRVGVGSSNDQSWLVRASAIVSDGAEGTDSSGSAGRLYETDLAEEMKGAYLEYAMSVIVGRALPSVADGLKPVHRRILYAMHSLNLSSKKPHKKCARVVGEVLGKYHPHGDGAVYDALVRMAQDFSLNMPLVDGHGNFGSVDGDPAAAMRYTESRLRAFAEDALLLDLREAVNCVSRVPTFDGSGEEPTVLPARVPAILVNGSQGIAVGMSTNIAPHNLGEVCDALVALLHNPDIDLNSLMKVIPGPDFPTGGILMGADGAAQVFSTGAGRLVLRGVVTIETSGGGRQAVVITELPYQVNKANLVERIADLVNAKRIEGVSDLRDESDCDGLRVVIECKRGADPQVLMNRLYKLTPLQSTFNANTVALVGTRPVKLDLRRTLREFIKFRSGVVRRRAEAELLAAEGRNHVLEGFLRILDDIDGVIEVIRRATDGAEAALALQETWNLSSEQTEAVLSLQLRRLTALEASKVQSEHEDLQAHIADLKDLLGSQERVLGVIEREATDIKERHATPRRTRIVVDEDGAIDDEEVIPNERSFIVLTRRGYVKRVPVSEFSAQRRGTAGKKGAGLAGREDADAILELVTCMDHDTILFFSESGLVYSKRAYEIPQGSRTAQGTPLAHILKLPDGVNVTAVVPMDSNAEDKGAEAHAGFLLMLTRKGFIKKCSRSFFTKIRSSGLVAISLTDGDELRWVSFMSSEEAAQGASVLVGCSNGQAIRFLANESQLPPRGRTARGSVAMTMKSASDQVVGFSVLPSTVPSGIEDESVEDGGIRRRPTGIPKHGSPENPYVLLMTSEGYGKRVASSEFRCQNRGGGGVIGMKFKVEGDSLRALTSVQANSQVMLASRKGTVNRTDASQIPAQSRTAMGAVVLRLGSNGDELTACDLVPQALIPSPDAT